MVSILMNSLIRLPVISQHYETSPVHFAGEFFGLENETFQLIFLNKFYLYFMAVLTCAHNQYIFD